MTDAADLLLTNAEVHTLARPDETHEAVAVRDGRIVRVGDAYELDFLAGVETERIDCDGQVLLPGFVDAHTHLTVVGRKRVHADLSDAASRAQAIDRLAERATAVDAGVPVLGFGYDESGWAGDYLTRSDLDAVDADGPVVAVREDLHVASLDSAALARFGDDLPAADVRCDDGGAPTGVVVEEATAAVLDALAPDRSETTALLRAAQRHANERGITGVHDMVRRSHAPRAYRDLDRAGDLTLRIRLNYWSDHLDALAEVGLRTNHGGGLVRVGAIKTFTDGSIGGRTARLSTPYADAPAERGGWTVQPDAFRDLLDRAVGAGFQVAAHAIGDEAVAAVVDAYEAVDTTGPAGMPARHRIEHAELATDGMIDRMADADVVASVQPNFHRWAGESGLYADRLGDRRTETNRLGRLADAGVHLAFGSDCMPLDPLLGVHHAVNAPTAAQRLGVTEALRAYTLGGAYAGFDEDRLGTVEPGKRADLVVLGRSPWDATDAIRDIDVTLTVVDGDVVHDGR
jgi:predicted amidohydrolase YtcJ